MSWVDFSHYLLPPLLVVFLSLFFGAIRYGVMIGAKIDNFSLYMENQNKRITDIEHILNEQSQTREILIDRLARLETKLDTMIRNGAYHEEPPSSRRRKFVDGKDGDYEEK